MRQQTNIKQTNCPILASEYTSVRSTYHDKRQAKRICRNPPSAFAKSKIGMVKWQPMVTARRCARIAALAWPLLQSAWQAADAAAPCYTHDEARNLWPQAHLYWHGSARCWDDSAPQRPRPPTSTSISAAPSNEPALPAARGDPVRISFPLSPKTTVYPELMPGSTSRDMLNPSSILIWPPLIDIDSADPAHFSVWNRRVSGQWGQSTKTDP